MLDPVDEEDSKLRSSWNRIIPREEFRVRRNELMNFDLDKAGRDPERREATAYSWIAFTYLVEKGLLECMESEEEVSFRMTEYGRAHPEYW